MVTAMQKSTRLYFVRLVKGIRLVACKFIAPKEL